MPMRCGLCLLILFVLLLPGGVASAHLADEFPQVTVQMSIDDEAVELIVRVPAKDASLSLLDGLSPIEMDQMEPADLAALVAKVFAERCPVRLDGVVVPPTVLGAVVRMKNSRLPARSFPEAQVMAQGALQFLARYETKGPPGRVSIDWSIYANQYDEADKPIHAEEDLQVVMMVKARGREQIVLFTPQEPSYTWHHEEAPSAPADLLVAQPIRRNFLVVPALSITLVLIGSGLSLGWLWSGRQRAWAGLVVSFAAGALALPIGQLRLEHTSSRAPMDEAQSLAIFESLLRNIYRAFDYTDEGAVYDALAQSVDGPMLETIYNDVYQSLIMREENGAVSKVVRVQIDEAQLKPVEESDSAMDASAYRVHSRWRVDGLVTHFGHSHARTNAFEAIYTIAPRGDGWRIVGAQILQQQRIDDGNQSAKDLRSPG